MELVKEAGNERASEESREDPEDVGRTEVEAESEVMDSDVLSGVDG